MAWWRNRQKRRNFRFFFSRFLNAAASDQRSDNAIESGVTNSIDLVLNVYRWCPIGKDNDNHNAFFCLTHDLGRHLEFRVLQKNFEPTGTAYLRLQL